MILKDRLEIVRLNNKYKSFKGIKSFRIAFINELTKNEKNVLYSLNKVSNSPNDKISLKNDYKEYISWVKEKIIPYVNCNSEIILIDGYYIVYLCLDNCEIFLKNYFEKKESFSIYIFNRDLKKCIAIYEGEYFLEYFNRDI